MFLITVNYGNIEINNSRFQKISGKRTAVKLTKSQLEIAKKNFKLSFPIILPIFDLDVTVKSL